MSWRGRHGSRVNYSYGGRGMPLGTLWPESGSQEILNLVLSWLPPFPPLIQSVNPLHRMVTAVFSDVFSLASTLESPSTLVFQMILNPVSLALSHISQQKDENKNRSFHEQPTKTLLIVFVLVLKPSLFKYAAPCL